MSKLIAEETKSQLQQILGTLESPVKLIFFTQENACPTCSQQLELLKELTAISNKLELLVYDFVLHGDEVMKYRIDKIPATAVIGTKDYGIRFYGLTAGYEFSSLVQAIVMVSGGKTGLDPQLEELVKGIKEPVHLQVLVTLTCPYCPRMVHVADQFAIINENIRADMVEASEFPHLAQRYSVTAVPKTVINETHSFDGALPPEAVYVELLKAVNPEEYARLQKAMSESKAEGKTTLVDEKHEYEVLIVGGGPAAISAAVYSARKGLDVALISKKLGGQIEYTATIENYLGMASVSGAEMAEAFRNHLANYSIAKALGTNVLQIESTGIGFTVLTEDNRRFKARSVIYCAGKEYNKLGVPGEEAFIGRGIGFCATCDAPLYRDKRVAVVGGGNSAFTAARDLIDFASEVHLIHRRKDFRADAALIEEVTKNKKVTIHTGAVVLAFLGKEKLTGIKLESVEDKIPFELNVDGVFLEIGLLPNTDPLKGLLQLNEKKEVPIKRDQSTTLEGLFAAGDVTDSEEKQISIAVGQGSLAAISAHKYLLKKELTASKAGLKEPWE